MHEVLELDRGSAENCECEKQETELEEKKAETTVFISLPVPACTGLFCLSLTSPGKTKDLMPTLQGNEVGQMQQQYINFVSHTEGHY